MAKSVREMIGQYIEHEIATDEREIDSDVLSVLDRWYESYQKIITFLGTSSGVVLLYTGLHLVQLLPGDPELRATVVIAIDENRRFLITGVVCLLLAIVSMVGCLVATYNWYKTGPRRIITASRGATELKRLLGDDMQYVGISSDMSIWGLLSLVSGLFTGLFLISGISLYAAGVHAIFQNLIY